MMCPYDPNVLCPYEDPFGDYVFFTCEDCEVLYV